MSMRLTINSIDGHNINDANFNAYWPNEDQTIFNLPDVDLQEVSRAGTWPDPSTEVLQGKDFAICIESLGTFASQIDTLKGWFDTKKKGLRKLLMTDENGKQWYVMCKCKSQPIIETSYTEFLMHASDPTLYSEVENSVSETVLATGHQWTLTPVGNDLARLRVTMTPNIAKTAGYGFKAYRPIVNPIDKAFVDHPYDITDGGWDTAALITASKMQASGNDLRPIISGTEVDHWNDGINTTTTKVWINANLAPGVKLTLLSAITNVQAVTELPFKITTLNKAYLKALPASGGKVIRNGEVFTYTAVDLIKCKLTGVTRGVNGTVKSAHAIGDIFNWVQYDCWIMYGNSTMDAPIVDDTKKPLLDLHNSTNTSWVLLNFTDIAGVRTGGFKPKVLKSVGKLSDYYTDTHGADADPAVEMGMVIRAYQTAIGWRGEDADIEWSLYNPAGIDRKSVV